MQNNFKRLSLRIRSRNLSRRFERQLAAETILGKFANLFARTARQRCHSNRQAGKPALRGCGAFRELGFRRWPFFSTLLISYAFVPLLFAQTFNPAPALAKPQFGKGGGFFDAPFALSLTSPTPGAVIYYSLDCSEPTPATGNRYTGPIAIASTSVVRARCFQDGFKPSEVESHTYLFLDDVLRQSPDGKPPPTFPASWGANAVDYGMDPNVVCNYSRVEWREALTQIPSISIITEMKNLFDPASGIYANALMHGDEWERPASIELLDSKKLPQECFQENCGLRIRGGYSRNLQYAKHSFRIFFRSEYGVAKLKYPLFQNEGASEFDTFDLRTSQNYSWAIDDVNGEFDTMVQEVFCRETLGALGRPTTRSRYYHLYLNGQYWGLYETQERPEAAYGSTYFPGHKEDFDCVKSANHIGAFVTESTDGNLDAFRTLWSMARAVAANPSNANYFAILGRNADGTRNSSLPVWLEVDDLIDYMLVIFYAGDGDAPLSWFINFERSNNWFGLRNRNNPNMGFIFFNHDAEHTLGAPFSQVDRTGPYLRANQNDFTYANPEWIHQDLTANAEYRLRFADHVQRHFFNGGALTPEAATNRFLRKSAQIDKAIRAYSARWGDTVREPPYGETDWRSTIRHIVDDWFPSRTAIVLDQLTKRGLFPQVPAPTVLIQTNSKTATTLTLLSKNSDAAIYFTADGTDPRLAGGEISPSARIYSSPVPMDAFTSVLARARSGGIWSALAEANLNSSQPTSETLILKVGRSGGGVTLSFSASGNRAYVLEYRDDLDLASWQTLTNFAPAPADRFINISDEPTVRHRFYRARSTP